VDERTGLFGGIIMHENDAMPADTILFVPHPAVIERSVLRYLAFAQPAPPASFQDFLDGWLAWAQEHDHATITQFAMITNIGSEEQP